jgi:cell division transport system permease protein
MISFVVFSLRRAWQGFWRNALMSLAATATMVLMLMLLAGFWILQTGLQASLDYTESKVEVVADLKDNVKQSEVVPIIAHLQAMPEVKQVTFISEDEALAEWRQRLAQQGEDDLTRYLDANPLHASLNVKLVKATVYAAVVSELRSSTWQSVIDKVKEQQDLATNLVTVTNVMRTAGTVILVVIAFIVLFIIVNTIRLAVVARAEEIEIMRLVGASDAFFLWLPSEPIGNFMVGFFQVLPLRFGSLAQQLIFLIGGAGLGLGVLGSWVSVRTYLIR